MTKRINCSRASYSNPIQDFSATNFSIPEIIEATEEILKSPSEGSLALNGIWISKASSIAKILSTKPILSIPKLSKVHSNVTSSGSWRTGGALNTARGFAAASTAGTQTASIMFAGYTGTAYTGATELYDGTSWTET